MTLHELFVDELKDLYSAESQLIKALPKMVKAADAPELTEALTSHLAETEQHLERLKQVFQSIEEKPAAELCKGMQGIVAEGQQQIEKKSGDLGLIGAGERVEHYEIASYNVAISLAKGLKLDEAVELLSETLAEEEKAAKRLSQLAKPLIKAAA